MITIGNRLRKMFWRQIMIASLHVYNSNLCILLTSQLYFKFISVPVLFWIILLISFIILNYYLKSLTMTSTVIKNNQIVWLSFNIIFKKRLRNRLCNCGRVKNNYTSLICLKTSDESHLWGSLITCNWYSRIGVSFLPSPGPNCVRTAAYRIAIVKALAIMHGP